MKKLLWKIFPKSEKDWEKYLDWCIHNSKIFYPVEMLLNIFATIMLFLTKLLVYSLMLDEKVEQWFVDRNLHEANPVKQFEKLMEEAGELFEGIAKGKSDLIKDALGDMQVVLTGLELQIKNGADIRATPEEMELLLMVASLGNLANKLYKHVFYDETKTPLIKPDLIMLHSNIHSVAIHNCTTADTCLKIAYDEIKDRKGKMIDGVFVKDADW